MRPLLATTGVTFTIAGAIQPWYAPAMLLYIPGIALILTALYGKRKPPPTKRWPN